MSRPLRLEHEGAVWHITPRGNEGDLAIRTADANVEIQPQLDRELDWPTNVWMGVSVENSDYVHRIEDLRRTRARVKFLSLEPLLGPLPNLNLRGIDWVIVGGESGPGARPMRTEWVIEIREQCRRFHVAFFFKQWGGKNKKKAGRLLEGRTWDEMPDVKPARSEGWSSLQHAGSVLANGFRTS